MNCVDHPEVQAVAFCRTCGKALCESCQRQAQGTIFCAEHEPAPEPPPETATPAASPWTVPPPPQQPVSSGSPGLAFVLGLIPGVGAIYNGQYAKGLVHVIILGLLISILNSGASGGLEPLFGLLIALWFFYMAFEAYHTAKKRALGERVDEFSSLFPMNRRAGGRFPVTPLVLIALGVVFLLNNLEIIRLYQLLRYWPVFLILLGVYLLYQRMSATEDHLSDPEATHEQR